MALSIQPGRFGHSSKPDDATLGQIGFADRSGYTAIGPRMDKFSSISASLLRSRR